MVSEVVKQFTVDVSKADNQLDAIRYFMDWRRKHGYDERLSIKEVRRKLVYVIYYSVDEKT